VIGNDYTEDYVKQFNNNVLSFPGPIDCGKYTPRAEKKKPNEEIIIGWVGSDSTSEYLKLISNLLKELCDEYSNVSIEIIGSKPIKSLGKKCSYKPWDLKTEVENIQNFDIGIMPLPNNKWTQGKCGYKIFQYMATGIPTIASPVGINTQIIENGITGFLAKNANDWSEKLKKLINDKALRIAMGKASRKKAEESYSFEFSTPKLIKCLQLLTQKKPIN